MRANLVTYASVLTEAETLDRAAYRERVRDVVGEMARTGASGMGFAIEHGGGGDIGASIAAFRHDGRPAEVSSVRASAARRPAPTTAPAR